MGILSNDLQRNLIMESKIQKDIAIEKSLSENDAIEISSQVNASNLCTKSEVKNGNDLPISTSSGETKIQLSFSVDRLLSTGDVGKESNASNSNSSFEFEKCCEQQNYSCCTQPNCLLGNSGDRSFQRTSYPNSSLHPNETLSRIYPAGLQLPTGASHFLDYTSKCIVRPLALRALSGNNCDTAPHCLPFPTLAATSLLRLHQHPSKQTFPHPHTIPYTPTANLTLSPLLVTPLTCNLKSLQLNSHAAATQHQHQQQQQFRQSPTSPNHFTKTKLPTSPIDISIAGSAGGGGGGGVGIGHYHPALHQMHPALTHPHHHQAMLTHLQLANTSSTGVNNNINSNNNSNGNSNSNTNNSNANNNNNGNSNSNNHNSNGKRKRSWSRAVFSNLQRKGLEIQFQQQKYITKPDRRKLAARLNLTDAQVKVWFQNRRMKWRHTRENLKSGQEKQPTLLAVQGTSDQKVQLAEDMQRELAGYSSDGSDSSMAISDNEDDGEIDVVE